jgi:hypothetical protein
MQRTPPPPPPLSVLDRFARIVDAACKAVGEAQNRGLPGPIAGLIWSYLQRLKRRFTRLAEMALAGTLKPPRQRRPPPDTPPPDAPPSGDPPERPRRKPRAGPPIRFWGWRWIARRAQYTDVFGGHLARLLEDPEMIRLIGMDRRFAPMLRPLAMGLGTQLITPGRLGKPLPQTRRARIEPGPDRPARPRKPRAKKITWKCARPPFYGLQFSDPTLNLWHRG